MKFLSHLLVFLATLAPLSAVAATPEAPQSRIDPSSPKRSAYPKIVLYSVSWCPHCRAAKEYLTKNNIPFLNRDVELDSAAMEELTKVYQSTGVPVIVFGNNERVLKGFNQDVFERTLKELQKQK